MKARSDISQQDATVERMPTPLRVLYLHMDGAFSGSARSLYEAVRGFPPGRVQPVFVVPQGTAATFFAGLGIVVQSRGLAKFDNTAYSHYRGARWLVVLRELAYVPATVRALREAKKVRREVDLVHVNDATGLVALWLSRLVFDVPAVVHVRSVLRKSDASWRTRWVEWMLRTRADAVVAIDETVRASLPAAVTAYVIHNTFSPTAASGADASLDIRLGGLRPGSFRVGFVGNLLRVKGIFEFLEAARLVLAAGIDADFIIVGGDIRPSRGLAPRVLRMLGLSQDSRTEVEAFLDKYSLRERVHLVGFTADIGRAFREMGVLCFPSHLDAPGRPIFEAAFHGVPSIVAIRNPMPDALIHGETGLAIEARSATQLATAIERLARDPAAARRMGEAARKLAERNFDVQRNAGLLLGVYERVRLARTRSAQMTRA